MKTAFDSVFPDLTEQNTAELDLLAQNKDVVGLEKNGESLNLKTFAKYDLREFVSLRDRVKNPSSQDNWKIRLTHQFVYGELSRFKPLEALIDRNNVLKSLLEPENFVYCATYGLVMFLIASPLSLISPLLHIMGFVTLFLFHSNIWNGALVFDDLGNPTYWVVSDANKGTFPQLGIPFADMIADNFFADKEVAKEVLENKRFELLPVKNDDAVKILLNVPQAELAEFGDSLYLLSHEAQKRIQEQAETLKEQQQKLETLKAIVPDLSK